jgi:hypothetical protein
MSFEATFQRNSVLQGQSAGRFAYRVGRSVPAASRQDNSGFGVTVGAVAALLALLVPCDVLRKALFRLAAITCVVAGSLAAAGACPRSGVLLVAAVAAWYGLCALTATWPVRSGR